MEQDPKYGNMKCINSCPLCNRNDVGIQGRGIYTLIVALTNARHITVGSLGEIPFPGGYYAYTGSARGTGGFGRIKRHLNVAAGINSTRRWHIDYLLPSTYPKALVLTHTDRDLECSISGTIGATCRTISDFGCTDCRCSGHLHFNSDLDGIISAVVAAHTREMGTCPVFIRL